VDKLSGIVVQKFQAATYVVIQQVTLETIVALSVVRLVKLLDRFTEYFLERCNLDLAITRRTMLKGR